MNKLNVMKSAVTIILLLFIIHNLSYLYKQFLNTEHSEAYNLDLKSDLKIEKMLKTTFELFSSMD